jgi:sulfoxide reductase catalytic subunit YedY
MLLRIRKSWEIPERDATPENIVINRRELLAAAGFLGSESFLIAKSDPYPAKRNPKFQLDRPITEEEHATGYNNFYEFDGRDKKAVKTKVDKFVTRPWTFEVTGLVRKPGKFDIDTIERTMPLEERLYRFRCVEAWSMAVPWTGFPISALIKVVQPKFEAKFVRFVSVARPDQMPGISTQPWYPFPYYEALRMDEAMNPLALLVTGMYGKPLPKQNGAPIRVIVPWKYGYKNPKSLVKIEFVAEQPKTFWNDLQRKEYGFYSNVNPQKPHPRWSQANEKVLPTMELRPTLLYNGYEKEVGSLYDGTEF